MTDDKKETELRTVYKEMDEDSRQKMEFLAVSLLDAQTSAEIDKPLASNNPKKEKNNQP